MKTAEVIKYLEARHGDGHAWVCLTEFERIDFLALACHGRYDDRRRERQEAGATHPWIGYEVKVSRADFRNEIRRPEKRAYARALCHEFYFCAPEGLIKESEVPEDCGLVVCHPGGTSVAVKSPIWTPSAELGHYKTALMLRHGINPNWLRQMGERKQALKWREDQAKVLVKDAGRELERARGILAARLKHTIQPGQRWTERRVRFGGPRAGRVVEVTDTTVVVDIGNESGYQPRYPIGDFLLEMEPEPSEEAATKAA